MNAPEQAGLAPAEHERVRRAFFGGWLATVGASLAAKVLSAAAQVIMVWFLVPEDFGLVGVAMGVNTIAVLLVSGPKEALIQRGDTFDQDAPQFFWLSMVLYLLGGALVVAASPLAAAWVDNPRVLGVVIAAGITVPFQALLPVPAAVLSRNLQFKRLAAISLAGSALTAVLSLTLAILGFGPYALLLPMCVVAPMSTVLMMRSARQPRIVAPQPRRWPSLLAPSMWLTLQNGAASLGVYGPVFLVARRLGAHEAGLFQWAYMMAFQIPFVLLGQLKGVLFPSFVALRADPGAQDRMYERSLRLMLRLNGLAVVAMAAASGVLVSGLFPERWRAAGPSLVWLSLGFGMYPAGVFASALFIARGRFKSWSAAVVVQTLVMLAVVAGAGVYGRMAVVVMAAAAVQYVTAGVLGVLPLKQGRWRYGLDAARVTLGIGAAAPLSLWGVRSISQGDVTVSAVAAPLLGVAAYCIIAGLGYRQVAEPLRTALKRA